MPIDTFNLAAAAKNSRKKYQKKSPGQPSYNLIGQLRQSKKSTRSTLDTYLYTTMDTVPFTPPLMMHRPPMPPAFNDAPLKGEKDRTVACITLL